MTTNCERFQAQLLDHLYDLLDDGDKHALEGHLADAPRRQEALRHAAGAGAHQRRRRLEFKTVRSKHPRTAHRPAHAARHHCAVLVAPGRRGRWRPAFS